MSDSDGLVSIRSAGAEDIETINSFCAMEGFGSVLPTDTLFVAESQASEIVGVLRLVFDDENIAHVNPVVVYPTWRGYGVGRALMDFASDTFGELRLVSRGSSQPFYEALGFEGCEWESIMSSVADECSYCELLEECEPNPMRRVDRRRNG